MSETCIRLGEHGARVMIENKKIPHFSICVEPKKKEVTCWIASEAGKAFSVVWLEVDIRFPSACDLYLDGRPTESYLRRKGQITPILIEHGIVSGSSSAPFIFSQLDATDDDSYFDTPLPIGEIKLVISRTTEPRIVKREECTITVAPPHLQKVHERFKKGITHRVNHGAEIPTPKSNMYAMDTLEPLVTFIFRYLPLEILRKNGIVPQLENPEPLGPQDHNLDTPPTPETSSGKGAYSKVTVKKEAESGSEIDDEDRDSMREKAILLRNELEKIRKGKKLKEERPKKRFKKEEKTVVIPDEIIDLT